MAPVTNMRYVYRQGGHWSMLLQLIQIQNMSSCDSKEWPRNPDGKVDSATQKEFLIRPEVLLFALKPNTHCYCTLH